LPELPLCGIYRIIMETMSCKHGPRRLMAILIVAAGICVAAASSRAAEVTITDAQNSKIISIARGDTLIVRLPINSGTGYVWEVTSIDLDKLNMIGKAAIEKGGSMPGAPETQVFRFQGIESGSGVLEMDLLRPSEKAFKPAKIFTVTVTVR